MPTITQLQLLQIASEQMAGMQAPGYELDEVQIKRRAKTALLCARRLAFEAGFMVEVHFPEVRSANATMHTEEEFNAAFRKITGD